MLQSAPSRLSERVNWSSITFILENSVFLLIGLQIAALLDDVVNDDQLSTGRTLTVGLAVLARVPGPAAGVDDPVHLLPGAAAATPPTVATGCAPGSSAPGPACAAW